MSTVASSSVYFKSNMSTPPSCRDVSCCRIPAFPHHAENDSVLYTRGFLSVSTQQHETTGQRMPDTKTARSGIDHLSVTRRTDYPSRRASHQPGRTTEIRDLWRPAMKASRVVINELNERRLKLLGGATSLEGRGAWPSVLSMRQRSVLDKSVLISLPSIVHLLQV